MKKSELRQIIKEVIEAQLNALDEHVHRYKQDGKSSNKQKCSCGKTRIRKMTHGGLNNGRPGTSQRTQWYYPDEKKTRWGYS